MTDSDTARELSVPQEDKLTLKSLNFDRYPHRDHMLSGQWDALGPAHQLTKDMIAHTAHGFSDFQPQHTDEAWAIKFGLPGLMAYGFQLLGTLPALVPVFSLLAENGLRLEIVSLEETHLRRNVFAGDMIRARTRYHPETARQKKGLLFIKLDFEICSDRYGSKPVVDGTWLLRFVEVAL